MPIHVSNRKREQERRLTEEIKRALALIVIIMIVDPIRVRRVRARKRDLPRQPDAPHNDRHDRHGRKAEVPARAAVEPLEVEHGVPDDERADDRARALKGRVQRARRPVEHGRVDRALVRVEVVGREEHGGERCHAMRSREYVHVIWMVITIRWTARVWGIRHERRTHRACASP